MHTDEHRFEPLSWGRALLAALLAAGCFHAAYTPAQTGPWSLLIVGYVVGLVQLARLGTTRRAFYAGLLTGLACFGPQLGFFWNIFGAAAIALWTVLAFWIALFVALSHVALVRLGPRRAMWLIPLLWTGLEYFRSELYYLRFSWLNVGFAFSGGNNIPVHLFGVYGLGLVAALFGSLSLVLRRGKWAYLPAAGFFFVCLIFPGFRGDFGRQTVHIAGAQLEFCRGEEMMRALDKLAAAGNDFDIAVLSEYTLGGQPTDELKTWCREHGKYLVVGGKEDLGSTNYYNTAFVIGTNGDIVFQQAKCVPIQFFKDGLPAPQQKVWDSPWGKVGICICYDLSYSRVTDELARQSAQLLIVPTMDVEDWGRHQHELHARVAPMRAAEYGIPVFRLASSGISQGVGQNGRVLASAPFPGEGEMLFFTARVGAPAARPLDRWLAPLCVGVTGLFVGWLALGQLRKKAARKPDAV